jgi:hypothetical protein
VLDGRPPREQRIDERQGYSADQRAIQRSRPAKQHQQQDEYGKLEADKVGVQILVLLSHHGTANAASDGGDDEGQDLIAIDADAHGFRRDLVGLQREKRPAKAPGQQVA